MPTIKEYFQKRNEQEQAMQAEATDAKRVVESQRAVIEGAASVIAAANDTDTVIRCMELFPEWTPADYTDKTGCVRLYGGYPYRCIQPHDSTDNPGLTPDVYGWKEVIG